MPSYEIISHTADIGLRVFGRDLAEFFSNAADGMFHLMVENVKGVKHRETVEVNLSGLSQEELLVSWLSELLYKLTEKHWLGIETEIFSLEKKGDKFFLRAKVQGQKIDYTKTPPKREIKAVTYHNLAIKKVESGYSTEIIFDV